MQRIFAMLALLTLILGTVVAADAWSQERGRGMGHGKFHGGGEMACDLKPTPEQFSRWKELKEKFGREILPLRNQLFSKRMELAALLAQPDANSEAIKSKHREIIVLGDQIQEKAMDHRLAFRQTLTPEQLSLWIAHKSARHWCPGEIGRERGRGPRHGVGPGCGMGPGVGMGPGCCYW